MNEFRTNPTLKALARGQLNGYYTKVIPVLFFHFITIMLLESMVMSLFSADALWADIIYYVIMFVISVFSGLFVAAEHFIYLKVCCHYPVSLGDIFFAFYQAPDRYLKIQFFLSLLNLICMLPYHVISRLYYDNNYYMIIAGALILLGNILYIFISLPFSLVFYLAIDFPKHEISKIFSLSHNVMNGHKVRFFYMEFGFLPLVLLSLLSLGIGFLWVVPYMYATEANFYLDLMAHRNRNIING